MKYHSILSTAGKFIVILAFLIQSYGCTSVIVYPLLDPLTLSLQKQTDIELLQEGAPSLLLLLDGLIANDPENERLLMAATKAYGVYAMILHDGGQTERAVNMSTKAMEYGISLLMQLPALKDMDGDTLEGIKQSLAKVPQKKVDTLFWSAYGWAIWIQYQAGAPAAMADLPIVEQIMLRVVELDEAYYYGGAHIFLGSYYGNRPQIFGGRPDASRKHFERALSINKRQFLPTQVAYAETYARTMFDRELYMKLLAEVIEQPLVNSDMAASNKVAKSMAEKLISQVDEFF